MHDQRTIAVDWTPFCRRPVPSLRRQLSSSARSSRAARWTPRTAAPHPHNVLMLCEWGAAMCPMSGDERRTVGWDGVVGGKKEERSGQIRCGNEK
jgi:hypothetical protein